MREWHNIYLENATARAAQPSPSPELPTVRFISASAPSGNLRSRGCNAAPLLRVGLATLSSVAAIALLVFFCWSVFNGRGALGLRTRRLATSDANGSSLEICGISGDRDGQRQSQSLHTQEGPDGEEKNLPLKKRKLARVAEATEAGDGRKPEHQGQQQGLPEPEAAQSGVPTTQPDRSQDQATSTAHPVHGLLPSTQAREQAEAEVVARDLWSPRTHQHDDGYFPAGAGQTECTEILRRQDGQHVECWDRTRGSHQQQLELREEMHSPYQQRNRFWRPFLEQPIGRQHWQTQMLIQQPQQGLFGQSGQQESLLQQQGQQPMMQHGIQQHFVQRPSGQSLVAQESQQLTPEGGRWQQHEREEREQRADTGSLIGTHLKLSEPAATPWEPFSEDPWIPVDSQEPDVPQPGTSQQAWLHPFAASAGPSMSEGSRSLLVRGFPTAFPAVSPAAAAAGTSGDIAAAAPSPGATRASGAAAFDWYTAGPSSAAPAAAGGGMNWAGWVSSGVHTGGNGQPAGTGSLETNLGTNVSSWTPANMDPSGTLSSAVAAVKEHPFARLPKTLDFDDLPMVAIDIERILTTPAPKRELLPLLQRAHDLLSARSLCLNGMRALAAVTAEILECAVGSYFPDLSERKNVRAVEQLGMRFLLMDSVVSALVVLGQPVPTLHWKIFADSINGNPPCLRRRKDRRGRRAFASFLSYELGRAIETLKTGNRPNPFTLVKLKRMLFCSPLSPPRFQQKGFDRWRMDDRDSVDGQ